MIIVSYFIRFIYRYWLLSQKINYSMAVFFFFIISLFSEIRLLAKLDAYSSVYLNSRKHEFAWACIHDRGLSFEELLGSVGLPDVFRSRRMISFRFSLEVVTVLPGWSFSSEETSSVGSLSSQMLGRCIRDIFSAWLFQDVLNFQSGPTSARFRCRVNGTKVRKGSSMPNPIGMMWSDHLEAPQGAAAQRFMWNFCRL